MGPLGEGGVHLFDGLAHGEAAEGEAIEDPGQCGDEDDDDLPDEPPF